MPSEGPVIPFTVVLSIFALDITMLSLIILILGNDQAASLHVLTFRMCEVSSTEMYLWDNKLEKQFLFFMLLVMKIQLY